MSSAPKSIAMLLCAVLIGSIVCAAAQEKNAPVASFDFDGASIADGAAEQSAVSLAPAHTALRPRGGDKGNALTFDGRHDSLLLHPLSPPLQTALTGAFTLEFEIRFDTLPQDVPSYPYVFEALDSNGKSILAIRGNKLGRFEVVFAGSEKGRTRSFLATWNHPTPTATAIQRRRWTNVALTVIPGADITLFIDGEILGQSTFPGTLPTVQALRFGGAPEASWKLFHGALDSLRIHTGLTHDKATAITAREVAAQRLRSESYERWAATLLPEKADWAMHHPRMILTPGRLAEVRSQLTKGRGPELLQRLLDDCRKWTDPKSPKYYNPSKFELQQDRYIVMTPALMAMGTLLGDNPSFARRAGEIAAAYAERIGYHDVARHHGSAAYSAGTTMMMALVYDWGYPHIEPAHREAIRESLVEIAAGAFEVFEKEGLSRDKWVPNWTAMATSTLGNACLAVIGETHAPVRKWLNLAIHMTLVQGNSAIDRDGAFHEGSHYFFYGDQHILVFLEALRTATGEDLLKRTNFARVPDYLCTMLAPWGQEVFPIKYSAASAEPQNRHMFAIYRKRLQSQTTEWLWQNLYPENKYPPFCQLFGLPWFQPETEPVPAPDLPLAKWFEGEGLVTFRTGWDPAAVAGTFHAHYARIVAHDQADRGQVTLYGYGNRWVVDSGGRNLRFSAHRDAHNLVIVDGVTAQPNPLNRLNWHSDSFITDMCHSDRLATVARSDLTPSYRYLYNWQHEIYDSKNQHGKMDPFEWARRNVVFMRGKDAPPYLLIADDLRQDEKIHSYTWHLHTGSDNRVTVDGARALCRRPPTPTIRYLYHPLGPVGTPGPKPDTGGFAEYDFELAATGAYALWGYGRAGDIQPGGMDSFHVQIDAESPIAWSAGHKYDYKWLRVGKQDYQLTKGRHTIRVTIREPEARVAEFALVPEGGTILDIPDYDASQNTRIDAATPTRLQAPFTVGRESRRLAAEGFMEMQLLFPQHANLKVTPFHPEAMPPHPRFEATQKTAHARFLAWCYPRTPDMEQPAVDTRNDSEWRVQWRRCEDRIFLNTQGTISSSEVVSDAELVVLRLRRGKLLGWVLVGGTFIDWQNHRLIELEGGKGNALFADGELSLSGPRVTGFKAQPGRRVKHTIAHGVAIPTRRTGSVWSPVVPLIPRPQLTW
ncbi:MAG: heparinase II/III family protein [Lentisphaeria bacterium]|nr:heparinase II/III family protein [Lentisphaeria bacterium]